MFSTSSDRLRYTVTCIINQNGIVLIDTIVDTGAKFTCYKADQISKHIFEKQFQDAEYKYIGGFVNGRNLSEAVKFYSYNVTQFTIGSIDLGARKIWITFDERIADNVLGIDILDSVTYLHYENSNELIFFKDRNELKTYVSSR